MFYSRITYHLKSCDLINIKSRFFTAIFNHHAFYATHPSIEYVYIPHYFQCLSNYRITIIIYFRKVIGAGLAI